VPTGGPVTTGGSVQSGGSVPTGGTVPTEGTEPTGGLGTTGGSVQSGRLVTTGGSVPSGGSVPTEGTVPPEGRGFHRVILVSSINNVVTLAAERENDIFFNVYNFVSDRGVSSGVARRWSLWRCFLPTPVGIGTIQEGRWSLRLSHGTSSSKG
jgi:hypothetical protein